MLRYTMLGALLEKGVVSKKAAQKAQEENEHDKRVIERRLRSSKRFRKQPTVVDLQEETRRLYLQLEDERRR